MLAGSIGLRLMAFERVHTIIDFYDGIRSEVANLRGHPHTIWTAGAPPPPGAFVQDVNARGMRYETDAQSVVTSVNTGGASIQNVEGCS